MKLGARMLKTGIAIAVALYIANLIGLESATYAGMAAAFAIQPNIYRSFQTMLEQMYANVLGVSFATAVVFFIGNDPIIIGFTVMIVISFCMYLRWNENTAIISVIAILSIMESTELMLLHFAGLRFSALTLGVVSAFLVNLLFVPPRHEVRLFKQLDSITSDILQWLRISTHHLSDELALRTELGRIQREIDHIDVTYTLFSEERIYRKKERIPQMRKLIICRQMIATTKKALETLKAIYHSEHKVAHIPKEFQDVLIEELDKMVYSHERLLLSAMGKIKKNETMPIQEITDPDLPQLVDSLIKVYEKDNHNQLSLLPLASRLVEYYNAIIHLEKLLHSYQKFHQGLKWSKQATKERRFPFR